MALDNQPLQHTESKPLLSLSLLASLPLSHGERDVERGNKVRVLPVKDEEDDGRRWCAPGSQRQERQCLHSKIIFPIVYLFSLEKSLFGCDSVLRCVWFALTFATG